jgi:hypothetical protein
VTATYALNSCEYVVLGDLFFQVCKAGDNYAVDFVGAIGGRIIHGGGLCFLFT